MLDAPFISCWKLFQKKLGKATGAKQPHTNFPLTFWQTQITIVLSQSTRSKSSPSIIWLCVDLISKSFPKLLVPDLTAVCKMPWWKNQSFAAFYTNLELYHSLLSCWMGALKLNVMSRGWGINPWVTFNFPAAKKTRWEENYNILICWVAHKHQHWSFWTRNFNLRAILSKRYSWENDFLTLKWHVYS